MLYYEHARLKKKLSRILEKHSALSHKLKSVVMGDLATRYDMIFEDSDKKFHYVHESCRLGRTLVRLINEYENKGYRLVFMLWETWQHATNYSLKKKSDFMCISA